MQTIFKILMQGPLEEDFNRISTRSSHKDRYRDHARTLRGFHQDLCKIFSQTDREAEMKTLKHVYPPICTQIILRGGFDFHYK